MRAKAFDAKRQFSLLAIILGTLSLLAGAIQPLVAQSSFSNEAVVLELNGPVTPASAGYLEREISAASLAKARLVIINIDTPGGLVTSMKDIIKAILASDTPVVTYVSPQGAQSASAGLYIMYSAHVSAMAPATNTGAATPVTMGGDGGSEGENPFEDFTPTPDEIPDEAADEAPGETDLTKGEEITSEEPMPEIAAPPLGNEDAMRAKIINDSVAYIRALAEKRDRNADWAESAVREAVSISANEALELNVIDIVAEDMEDLLAQIDGREVVTAAGSVTIDTSDIQLREVEPALWERILAFFADPNVAAILLTLGTTGLIAEIWNPGSIFPGIFGLICLLLALYSFSVLPYSGLALAFIIIGVLMVVLEAYTPTFGIVGLAGLAVFAAGLYFLFPDAFRISPTVIGGTVVTAGAFLALALGAIVRSRAQKKMTGEEGLLKAEGVVDEWDEDADTGHVIVEGERWKARSSKPLSKGDKVKVIAIEGLILVVKSLDGGKVLSRLMPGGRKATQAT